MLMRVYVGIHKDDIESAIKTFQAILDVGEVLQFYDSDKCFPCLGFCSTSIDDSISHCFNLNGNNTYCEVEGIQGIMMAYMSALHNVSLAGLTLFGPVITSVAHIAIQF